MFKKIIVSLFILIAFASALVNDVQKGSNHVKAISADTFKLEDKMVNHPRNTGEWIQFGGGIGLRSNKVLSDVLYPDSPFTDHLGKPYPNYPDGHYQNFLSEVVSFNSKANAVGIWGDAMGAAKGTQVWGGFFSARSDSQAFQNQYKQYVPTGVAYDKEFDSQLVGTEIDVLNGGKKGVYPNKSKVGLQIVGFGNTNSTAIEVLAQNAKPEADGRFENGLYFKQSITDFGNLIVSDLVKAKTGVNFGSTLFEQGAFKMKSEQANTGIVVNDGKSGEIYGGERFKGQGDNSQYLSLRAGLDGARVVSNDSTQEIMRTDKDNNIIFERDVYFDKVKAADLIKIVQDQTVQIQQMQKQIADLQAKVH